MSDELGRVTFFEVERFGFYKFLEKEGKDSGKNHAEKQNISVEAILEKLYEWVNGNNFENTLPLATDGRLKKKVYCRNAYKCPDTGDFFFVLWKSEVDGNGNIQGVDASANVSSSVSDVILLPSEQKGGKKYIWGKPCYYWYISSIDKFAAIKFPHSNTDTYLFARYVKDFVNFRMDYSGRKVSAIKRDNSAGKEYSYQTATFASDDGDGRVRFLFDYKLFMKKANKISLKARREKITHIVIRDTIGASVPDGRAWWSKMIDYLPGYKAEKPNLKREKQIELVLEETPTVSQLDDLYEFYMDGFTGESSWNNIGFKEGGKYSPPKWLDEYVLRETISAPYSAANKQHISAQTLATLIAAQRDILLQGLDLVEDEESIDNQNEKSVSVAGG